MRTFKTGHALVSAFAFSVGSSFLVSPALAQQTVTQASDEVEMTLTLPTPTDSAWIKGLSDFEGIERALAEASVQGRRGADLFTDRFSARAREIGVDLNGVRDLANATIHLPFILERVEFVPGLDASELNNGIITDFDGLGEYEGGEFSPGMPDKNSLSGFRTSSRAGRSLGGSLTWHYWTYSDGSTTFNRRVRNESGDTIAWTITITDENGNVEYSREEGTDPDGNWTIESKRNEPPGDEHSEAYEAEKRHARAQGLDIDDDSSGDRGDADAVEKPSVDDPALDKFQPANGEGSYCPLVFEICRRQMEQAFASGEDIFTGMILVNPGDPDVQPVAPRLIIDPKDLVIDPSGRSRNRAPRRELGFSQAVLPVWVNPAGPNEVRR